MVNRRGFLARSAAVLAGLFVARKPQPKIETLHSLAPDTYEQWNHSVYDPMDDGGGWASVPAGSVDEDRTYRRHVGTFRF